MQTLADIGEDALIRRLVDGLKLDASVIAGPGDDCAVVMPPKQGERLLLKTDTVVEGVHFTADTAPRLIGRKAMARVISDFAAMAATPRHAMITLIAPAQTLETCSGVRILRAMNKSSRISHAGSPKSPLIEQVSSRRRRAP